MTKRRSPAKPKTTPPAVSREEIEQIANLGEQLGVAEKSAEFAEALEQFAGLEEIEVGDHVYVGEAADDKVHWEVDYIHPAALNNPDYPGVRLISGMTGRMRMASYASLTLHSKGARDGQA